MSRFLRHARATLVAGPMLAAAGCYEADFPLDRMPQVEIDSAILGTWRCLPTDDSSGEAATFTVNRSTDRVYAITFQEAGKDPDRYEAYASSLNGISLLNVRELKSSRKPWVFARYSFLRPRVLEVQIVSDTLLKQVEESPTAIRHAVESLRENPALYADYCVCIRAGTGGKRARKESAVQQSLQERTRPAQAMAPHR